MSIPYPAFQPTGWLCPRCGTSNSPSMLRCLCTSGTTPTITTPNTAGGEFVCGRDAPHFIVEDRLGKRCATCRKEC